MGNPEFEELKEGQEVEFEVLGNRFQQGDTSIAVLAKLKSLIKAAPLDGQKADAEEPMLAAPVTPLATGTQKVVTIVPTEPSVAPVARKRKLKPVGE